jgi:hypothetical protein
VQAPSLLYHALLEAALTQTSLRAAAAVFPRLSRTAHDAARNACASRASAYAYEGASRPAPWQRHALQLVQLAPDKVIALALPPNAAALCVRTAAMVARVMWERVRVLCLEQDVEQMVHALFEEGVEEDVQDAALAVTAYPDAQMHGMLGGYNGVGAALVVCRADMMAHETIARCVLAAGSITRIVLVGCMDALGWPRAAFATEALVVLYSAACWDCAARGQEAACPHGVSPGASRPGQRAGNVARVQEPARAPAQRRTSQRLRDQQLRLRDQQLRLLMPAYTFEYGAMQRHGADITLAHGEAPPWTRAAPGVGVYSAAHAREQAVAAALP